MSKPTDFTPFPWTVVPDIDHYGHYVLCEAATEQEEWVSDGYEISEKEGERRRQLASRHDAANARLMSTVHELLQVCEAVAKAPLLEGGRPGDPQAAPCHTLPRWVVDLAARGIAKSKLD